MKKLLESLVKEPDFEWLIIDTNHCKIYPHDAEAKGDNKDIIRTKGALYTKIQLTVANHGIPVRVFFRYKSWFK